MILPTELSWLTSFVYVLVQGNHDNCHHHRLARVFLPRRTKSTTARVPRHNAKLKPPTRVWTWWADLLFGAATPAARKLGPDAGRPDDIASAPKAGPRESVLASLHVCLVTQRKNRNKMKRGGRDLAILLPSSVLISPAFWCAGIHSPRKTTTPNQWRNNNRVASTPQATENPRSSTWLGEAKLKQ